MDSSTDIDTLLRVLLDGGGSVAVSPRLSGPAPSELLEPLSELEAPLVWSKASEPGRPVLEAVAGPWPEQGVTWESKLELQESSASGVEMTDWVVLEGK
ncbi:hypothetical protein D623_10023338 [Myotis brandtii]|uniref:Uncharacterized protein n=1 Tax=Myotis brandtii TaxID=109478 RepID=S7NHK0_MYOBR|nr:hypothetical protein D623_10023338 [Myotis brandtii]